MEHVSQTILASLALYGVAVGILLGIIYDVFRILRIAAEPSFRLRYAGDAEKNADGFNDRKDSGANRGDLFRMILIAVEDVLYSVICAIVISVMIFHINSGHPRWFILLGTAVGFFVYYCTVGKLIIFFSSYIILFVRSVCMFILKLTLFPLLRLFRFLMYLTGRAVLRIYHKLSGAVLVRRELTAAESGFGMKDILRELRQKQELPDRK